MRLAISNLAWAGRDAAPYEEFVTRQGITGIEIAPTTVLGADPASTSLGQRSTIRSRLRASGLTVIGVQSLYFGHPELQLLATGAARRAFIDYTCRIADVCADLGGTTLVFGAPMNRRRDNLEPRAAMTRAAGTLHDIGDYCSTRNTVLTPEALPTVFGGDFIHTIAEAAELVRLSDSSGIGVHIDTGTSTPEEMDRIDISCLRSVQISGGPGVLRDTPEQRRWADVLLGRSGPAYEGWLSIELPPANGSDADNLMRIGGAIALVKELYGCT